MSNYIWVEKYRPDTVKNIILPGNIRKLFNVFVSEKEIPNLLLHSNSPGVGKTTIAKAICHDIGSNYLYINASSESGVDVLRHKITSFATGKSIINKGTKVVILDECDGTTDQFQKALRPAMEQYSKHCRFILTCNFLNRIIEPVISRCQLIEFDWSNKSIVSQMEKKILKRLSIILKYEKVEFDVAVLEKLIQTRYPDIRKMLNILQQYSKSNENVIDIDIFKFQTVDDEFYKYILDCDFTKARKYCIESNVNYTEMYKKLYDNFLPIISKELYPEILDIIGEYDYKNSQGTDKEIQFACCLMSIIGSIQGEGAA